MAQREIRCKARCAMASRRSSEGGQASQAIVGGEVMRFDLTRPCADCPFRSDRTFGLLPARVREILGNPKGHKWWPAASFPCHKTIDYSSDRTIIPKTAQQCAGVMAILHREGRPNDAMQLAERMGMWSPSKLDWSAPFYESTQAAIDGQRRKR